MRIDVLVNGDVIRSFYKKDIRDTYDTLGQIRYNDRIDKIIQGIKDEFDFKEDVTFCKVYETY